MQTRRLPSGGRIDRDAPLTFRFNGRSYQGYRGDTVASALLANGINVVARSFKYHRPRGIIGSGAEEPNALLQIGRGATTLPNQRATQTELYDGLVANSVNCWPGPQFDLGGVMGWFARLLPAGFYYKTFMWPQSFWHYYEKLIRRAAGLGYVPRLPDPDRYDKHNLHCDVLVVGGGPAGITAALAAGRAGARVLIADEHNELGGSLLHEDVEIAGVNGSDWLDEALAELAGMDEVIIRPRSTVFGYYSQNWLAMQERRTDHLDPSERSQPRERLWRIRAARVVLATGAIERPLVFCNNDRPGVMLASAVSSYIKRYAVRPGSRAVVFTNNDSAYQSVLDMQQAGISVQAIVDVRAEPGGELFEAVAALQGVEIIRASVVHDVVGTRRVSAVAVAGVDDSGDGLRGESRRLECDLLAVSGGWSPAVHLHAQSGARAVFDAERACFMPGTSVQAEQSAGACRGLETLKACLDDGAAVGAAAARAAGFKPGRKKSYRVAEPVGTPLQPLWQVPARLRTSRAAKKFVDYQNDTTAGDLQLAVREGYRSIEHVKRYTAMGFGTDQGKLGNINGMAIVAASLGQDSGAPGTTTFRPAYTPVTFGTLVGRDLGDLFEPIRKTAMHEWHVERGARFEDVGQWKRPWFYPRAGESMADAVNRECLAARNGVAIMDASTLGKIEVRGPDAAEFLNRIYTNGWSKLGVGRCRYGLMLGEDGMVMDDGVSARLADDHFYMTTTTGGAAGVLAWMERWLQTEWPELQVYLTSVTDQWATIGVVGPHSREVLQSLVADVDFDGQAFPFMSLREGKVGGSAAARIFRISFSGELAYEINVAANLGRAVWEAVMAAGEPHGITPYGTETMHVLRAEKGFIIVGQDTDGSVTPGDLGMDWILSKHKDYLGRRSLLREDSVRADRKHLVGLMTTDPQAVLPEGAQLVESTDQSVPIPMLGHVTSSYYSACLGHSIALALVKGGRERMGDTIHAPLAGGRTIGARVVSPVFYDTQGERQHG